MDTNKDMESHLSQIKSLPVDDLVRRFDFRTKVAVEELTSLSSFMKKTLLYLAAMATLSIYLNMITKGK